MTFFGKKAVYLALVTMFGLSACDNSNINSADLESESGENASDILLDGSSVIGTLLVTGQNGEADSQWFCSIVQDGNFIRRTTLMFWDDSRGQVGVKGLTWSINSNQLDMNIGGSLSTLSDLQFSSVLASNDHFDALESSGLEFNCDWSGEPRVAAATNQEYILLDDGSLGVTADSEENQKTVEELLINGSSPSTTRSYWECLVENAQADISYYTFYSTDRGYTDMDIIWYQVDATSIAVETPLEEYRLLNINFSDSASDMFSANRDNGVAMNCSRKGTPRATAIR